jgi:hypothetical protein
MTAHLKAAIPKLASLDIIPGVEIAGREYPE